MGILAWFAKAGLGAIISHLAGYVICIALSFYLGTLYATKVDATQIERTNETIVQLREERNRIEHQYYLQQEALKEKLNAYKRDDQLHRREIDALKRIQERGCILSDEELEAHPYSRKLRDGFLGRVRP
jgi:hypothetical protein